MLSESKSNNGMLSKLCLMITGIQREEEKRRRRAARNAYKWARKLALELVVAMSYHEKGGSGRRRAAPAAFSTEFSNSVAN